MVRPKKRTEMNKLVREMACYCFIYDVDLRYLVKEHKICLGKDPIGKVDYILADPLYIVRKHQKNDYPEYDVFGASNTMHSANVLKEVVKSGAHGHLFY